MYKTIKKKIEERESWYYKHIFREKKRFTFMVIIHLKKKNEFKH